MYIHFFKRIFDFIIGVVALPFVLLTIIIIAPIIWFEDKGNPFYVAQRIGKKGKPFGMLKFRSMKMNAPDIRLSDGSTYNGDDDPRVTKVGRFLRNTSIDEIPQFLNVLCGHMSLIGPRPDPLDWLENTTNMKSHSDGQTRNHGYNQAYFRNSVDGTVKLRNDVYYAENISFALDAKIVIRTIKTVLLHENVNIEENRK